MMPFEPIILAAGDIGTPEIVGVVTLSAFVAASSFSLAYFVLKSAREERKEERETRAKEAAAMSEALQVLKDVATRRVS